MGISIYVIPLISEPLAGLKARQDASSAVSPVTRSSILMTLRLMNLAIPRCQRWNNKT